MIEKKIPFGGLNTDDGPVIFPAEDYSAAQNISVVVAADGKVASIKPVVGNRNVGVLGIDDPIVPDFTEDFIQVASYEEKDARRTYYFVTHTPTGGSNYILMYDWDADEVKFVMTWIIAWGGWLGTPITGITKVGDILYWTEYGREPRKINVERGLRTFDGTYVSPDGSTPEAYDTSTWDFYDFTIIRPAPVYPLNVEKDTSGSNLPRVMENAYQFSYRYVYREGEYSVIAPYSKLMDYADDDSDDTYNSIKVSVPPQEFISNEVQRVEFLVRYGNIGSWNIFHTVDRADQESQFTDHNSGTPMFKYFFDDRAGVAVSDSESSKMFDSVPVTSEAIAAARNRLFLGNNNIGYTLPDDKVTIKVGADEVGATSITGTYRMAKFQINDSGIPYNILVVHISGAPSGDGYYFVRYYPPGDSITDFTGATLPTSVTLGSGDRIGESTFSDSELADAAKELLLDRYGVDLDDTSQFPDGYTSSVTAYTGPAVTVNGIGSYAGNFKKFKAGGAYEIGIVFFDRFLRNAGVSVSDAQVVNIPARTYSDASQYYSLNWAITFGQDAKIPDWAYYYAIVRTKDLTRSFFFQHISDEIKYLKKDDEGAYDFTGATNTFSANDTEYIAFKITPAVNDGLGYQYQEGDRLIAWSPNEASDPNKFEFPIAGQSGQYVIVEKPVDLGDTSTGDNQWMLIEVYTPRRPSSEEIYYEIGENFYYVSNPGTASRAFSVTVGASYSGDVWVKTRDVSTVDVSLDDVKAEAMSPSDDRWADWYTDIGRGHIRILTARQEARRNSIVYSNQWLPGSPRNGLSSFDALDYRDLDEDNGDVRYLALVSRTRQEGSVMLAICENEVSSIYLGETQLIDNTGEAIIASSGEVIGTINNLRGGKGTIHPESVAEEDGRLYWWDAINGEVCRYSTDGIFPVSSYKMERFFRLLGPESRNYRMPGAFNRQDNTYLLAIPISPLGEQSLNDYTPPKDSPHLLSGPCVLAFHEDMNRWVTKYTFYPSGMSMAGNVLLSWDGGRLYVHDDLYGVFYGTGYPSQVSFLLNINPHTVKILQSIAVEANAAPDWVHIRNEHPYIQSSDLESTEFTDREGVYYAVVMRDRLTPGVDTVIQKLFRGDTIRGQHIRVAIEYESGHSAFEVHAITLKYSESYGHQNLQV